MLWSTVAQEIQNDWEVVVSTVAQPYLNGCVVVMWNGWLVANDLGTPYSSRYLSSLIAQHQTFINTRCLVE